MPNALHAPPRAAGAASVVVEDRNYFVGMILNVSKVIVGHVLRSIAAENVCFHKKAKRKRFFNLRVVCQLNPLSGKDPAKPKTKITI